MTVAPERVVVVKPCECEIADKQERQQDVYHAKAIERLTYEAERLGALRAAYIKNGIPEGIADKLILERKGTA